MFNKILLINIFFVLSLPVFSQDTIPEFLPQNDTLPLLIAPDTFLIKKFSDFSFSKGVNNEIELDTSLNLFYRYNPAHRNFNFTLGNPGLAHHSFLFEQQNTLGFVFEKNYFKFWELGEENIFHYNSRVPYTEVFLILGPKKEQYFNGLHSQNISRNWNFGFQFNKIRSEGFYQNQDTDITNAAAQTNYLSPSKKYGALVKMFFNNNVFKENGGLSDEGFVDIDSRLIPVNLSSAINRRNSKGFNVKQYFNLSTLIDSILINDSIAIKNFKADRGFSIETSYNDNRNIFKELNPQNDYYTQTFDTTVTLDSIRYRTLNNVISYNNFNDYFSYSFWYKNQYSDLFFYLPSVDSILMNHFIGGNLSLNFKEKTRINVETSYLVAGSNFGDLNVSGKIDKKNGATGSLIPHFSFSRSSPFFIYNQYYSNHFNWDKQLNKITTTNGGLKFNNSKIKLNSSIEFFLINNYVFFNSNAMPEQHTGNSFILKTRIDKHFKIGKFHFIPELVYQKTSTPEIVRLPDLLNRNSFFFETEKRAFRLQIGVDLLYFTKFFNYNYMPVTRQFFLQNEISQGNYPFFNAFINIKVKKVRAFIQMDHLNQGILEPFYSLYPYYPYGERGVRFGISWVFLN